MDKVGLNDDLVSDPLRTLQPVNLRFEWFLVLMAQKNT